MKFEKRRSHLWVTVPVILLLVLVRFALHFFEEPATTAACRRCCPF